MVTDLLTGVWSALALVAVAFCISEWRWDSRG